MRVVAEVVATVNFLVGQHLVPTTEDFPTVECGEPTVGPSITVQEAAAVAGTELAMVEAVVELVSMHLRGFTQQPGIWPVATVLLP
jgi:hypothetical protein